MIKLTMARTLTALLAFVVSATAVVVVTAKVAQAATTAPCSTVYLNYSFSGTPFMRFVSTGPQEGYWVSPLLRVPDNDDGCRNITAYYDDLRTSNGAIPPYSMTRAAVIVRMTDGMGRTKEWGNTYYMYAGSTRTVVTGVMDRTWYEFRLRVTTDPPFTSEVWRPLVQLRH